MLIPNKHNGYSGGVRRLCMPDMDDGGGAAQPSDKTTQISELPEWARGYAKDVLAKGAALTDINQNPYRKYEANRIADFSPMQYRSFQGANDMRPSSTTEDAAVLATQAGTAAYGTNYRPGQFSSQFTAPEQFSASGIRAPSLQNYQMLGPKDVTSEKFGQQAATDYMSPYMQSVVGIQQREAQRQADIARTQRNAQAVGAGAFGGSRQAIMDAEAARNLATQKGDIQAQGLQSAFGQAQQQFNADQAQRMQAALANQGMGFNVGAQNLAANLGVQQLGAGQNLQAQLANEQSRQFGAGQGLQAANLAAQYGQSAQQLGEQSRQYGAGLGMQGLQTGLQAAGQLGQLGGQQFQQGMDINKLQNVYGGQMQQQAQRPLDQAYQDFLNQQNYPYKQLGFMSDMINKMPLGQQSTSSIYSQGPGTVQTLAGLGGAAYGFGKSGLFAEGGEVKTYAGDRGSVTSQDNKDSIVEGMYSMKALQKAKEAALARRDVDTAEAIDERIAELNAIQAQSASLDRGLGSAYDQIPSDRQEEMMYGANGGIVAFAPGGATYGKRFEQSLTDLKAMANKAPVEPTPEQRDEAISARIPMLEKRYGPDITQPYLEETKAKRAKLPEQMEKDQGLAIAMASLGLLARNKKPGESQKQQLISGIGEAGQQFIGEVGRLKKENREVDDKLRQSEILLATAQQSRKEGLINKADAEETRAQDLKRDAFKTELGLQEKIAQLESGLAGTEMQGENALRVAGVNAASNLQTARLAARKPSTQMEGVAIKADEIRRQFPEMPEAQVRDKALEAYLAQTKTGMGGVDARIGATAREKAVKDFNDAIGPGGAARKEYKKIQKEGTPEQVAAFEDKLFNKYLGLHTGDTPPPAREQPAPNAPAQQRQAAPAAVPPQAVDILKKNPSPQNIQYFDQTFGPGAAARALGR